MVAAAERPVGLGGRMVSNTLIQFVPPALRAVLGLALSAALSRYLGVGGFGGYALVFAYVAIFGGVFSDWGLGTICLREISQRPAERPVLVRSAAALQLCIATGSYAVLLAGLAVFRFSSAVDLAIVVYGLTLFLSPLDVLTLPFQADLRLPRVALPSLLGIGANFVLTLVIIALHGPLVSLVAASLAALVLQYIWTTALSLRVLGTTRAPLVVHWGRYLRESWPLGLTTVFTAVSQQGPLLAVSLVVGLDSAGIYGAGSRITQQLTLLPLIIRTTTFPLLASYWTTDRAQFERATATLVNAIVLVAVPLVVVLVGVAHVAVAVVFGPSYQRSATVVQILAAIVGISIPALVMGEAMVAAGHQRVNLVVQALAAPILVGLLLLLVPRAGADGAAGALAATWVVIGAATVATAWRLLPGAVPLGALVAGVVACGCGVAVVQALAPWGLFATGMGTAGAVGILVGLRPHATREVVETSRRLISRPAL